eukprot:CAMPEP_0114127876 /NCGR_PEP_ID=MMETSP0043_2-20121206/10630_1 /TAXON_ID=464988 /ORGANISM="Hemiselmis andersenii, Strain CCMP644" /LENGTH=450 /DNA_ID=CAMNT_0001221023 /DNA_START=51 /DNA_END=1403 /DNA_ORIENTATION=+
MARPGGPQPRAGVRPTHPGVVFASFGCCQPREKMDDKVAKAMYGDMADQGVPRKKKEALCSWCYEQAVHYFIKETSTWLCDACKGRTAESPKAPDCMARLEGSGKGSAVCAKSKSDWEELVSKKKQAFSKPRNATKIRYEMTRESPYRHMAQKEGLIRPFVCLVSMSCQHRCLMAIQLGWCPISDEGFGDPHEESWNILSKKGLGLRARCVGGLNKLNPFAPLLDWVGVLNHVASTLYVPSYMSWNDEFQCEKMTAQEGKEESVGVHSRKVEQFESELMDKVSKQQRSKMNRVQVCTVAQLMTSDNLRKLMALQQARGVERHSVSLFAIDSCFLQLARDKHLEKGQDADPVQGDELVTAVATFLSNLVEGDIDMFAEAGLKDVKRPSPDTILNANFEPLWLTLGTLGMKPHSTMARVLPCIILLMMQKEKLRMAQIDLTSSEFNKPSKDV